MKCVSLTERVMFKMNSGNAENNSASNMQNEWAEENRQAQERPSDSEETNAYEPDDESKIKPEVELKEETGGFVYKADFRGHLQLVSLNHPVHNQCGIPENNPGNNTTKLPSGNAVLNSSYEHKDEHYSEDASSQPANGCRISGLQGEWEHVKSILPTADDAPQVIVAWEEETKHSNNNHIYRQLKNMSDDSVEESYFIKEEPTENNSQECSYVHTLPEIYDYSSDSAWEQQFTKSSQDLDVELQKRLSRNGNSILLTQAEKKRLYRMRIKEENPTMWSTIKKREAARKREQREKRRHILFEMQRAMEFASIPDSPDVENHKLYLEALKERYPELWNQLVNALPETQIRNDQVFNERNPKSRRQLPKPVKMYKDVIEAQKKRIYRQRIKEERPEMYARQKARDAYARSMQRLMIKKVSAEKNEFDMGSFPQNDIEKKLTYLQNLQVEHIHYMESERLHAHFPNEVNLVNANPSTSEPSLPSVNSSTKSDPSPVCDNSEGHYNISKNSVNDISKSSLTASENNISNGDKTKEGHEVSNSAFPKSFSVAAACSTQSDILWYWNDVRGNQCAENLEVSSPRVPYAPSRRTPLILTEEERLQKILKERMQLKEKRRRYRMNMTPEKRSEFLEIERERLKAYRLKKKVATLSMDNSVQNEMICVDQ